MIYQTGSRRKSNCLLTTQSYAIKLLGPMIALNFRMTSTVYIAGQINGIGHNWNFLYTIKQDGKSYRLSETVEERDLGVLVRSDLGVSSQCTKAAKKAMKILGIIRRQFKNTDKETFLILYKSFVRPHMEYAIQAWSPHFRKDIDC